MTCTCPTQATAAAVVSWNADCPAHGEGTPWWGAGAEAGGRAGTGAGEGGGVTNRILWNQRDHDIDEIVLSDVATVHVEQMNDRCWWIGITLANGTEWSGNFTADSRGRMRFDEQEGNVVWDEDREHREGS